jgi:hypothetical protein
MWQIHALMALDLARERAEAARSAAAVERAFAGRPSAMRRFLASTFRGVRDAADAVAHASAAAARSLDSAG